MHPTRLSHHERPTSRRDFLTRAGGGLGLLALASLLEDDATGAAPPQRAAGLIPADGPLAAKAPHFPAAARSVIWLFMDGGPSHVDLFDPKPELTRLHGKPLPGTFRRPVTAMGRTAHTPLLASKRK